LVRGNWPAFIHKGKERGRQEGSGLPAKFGGSGLCVEGFCRRQGISSASFYRWRVLLRNLPGVPPETRADDPRVTFLDLGTFNPESTTPSAKPRLDLRLELGDGLFLHLVRS